MSSTKWQQFWSGRIEAPYRFALHDYLARPRAYATISTAEMCLKLINSSWPDGFARITASYRCAAQGPRLAVCSPPPPQQLASRLVSPGYLESCSARSPEWCLIVVADLVHLWMSEKTHWIISGLRIHVWVCWANNSLTNNILLIYIYIYMYIQQLKKTVYTLIFLVLINVWKVF